MESLLSPDAAQIVERISIVMGLVIIIVTGRLGWWVWAWQVKDAITSLEKQIALCDKMYGERIEDLEKQVEAWRATAAANLDLANKLAAKKPSTPRKQATT